MKRYLCLLFLVLIMLSFVVFPALALGGEITLRVHYHRPDGDYSTEYGPWELWLSDPDGITGFEPPYGFLEVGGDRVVTVKVRTGTQRVGFVVRSGEWVYKDVYEDQFIEITGVQSGTLDFYIESGVYGGRLVKGDDVIEGTVILDSAYKEFNRNGRPEVSFTLSRELPYAITPDTFKIVRRSTGSSSEIISVWSSKNKVYLELSEPLDLRAKYDILFEGAVFELQLPFVSGRELDLPAWYPADVKESTIPDDCVRVHVWAPKEWDAPYIYCWPSGGDGAFVWPGTPCEYEVGDWYTALIPKGENHFIVSNYGSQQTDDHSFDSNDDEVWIVPGSALDGAVAVYHDVCRTPSIEYCYSSRQDAVRIQWTAVNDVDGYELRRSTTPDDLDSFQLVKTITDPSVTTYTNTSLDVGTTYYYRIQSFVGDDAKTRLRSELSGAEYVPATTVFNEPYSNSSFRIRLRWFEVDGADGYQISRKEPDGSYRVIKTIFDGGTNVYSNVGLDAGSQYTYRMRAFTIDEGGKRRYGAYSDELVVGVQPATPRVYVSNQKTGKLTFSWGRIIGADSYQIWMATSQEGEFSIVKSIRDGDTLSYTKNSLDSGKVYYFKMRACSTVDGKRIFGAFCETIAVEVK